jgi:GNAT superfamily N-acetyltransferase
MSWVIRDYQPDDLASCLRAIQSNTPKFFADYEVDEFVDDLKKRKAMPAHRQWPYFVLVTNNQVRACGGYFINAQQEATLIWGMVQQSEHRKGLGTLLLNYRVNHMKGKSKSLHLDTTPESFKFYEKAGFKKERVEKDGYAVGLDTVFAKLDL